jgi:hypothetical protein
MSNLASDSEPSEMELLDARSKHRAAQALRCLPFNQSFYTDAQNLGLNAETVLQNSQYCKTMAGWFQRQENVEDAFRWLITVGILRREVDGQGLTARIRLTPLGRQLLEQSPGLPSQQAGLIERMHHCLRRYWPRR